MLDDGTDDQSHLLPSSGDVAQYDTMPPPLALDEPTQPSNSTSNDSFDRCFEGTISVLGIGMFIVGILLLAIPSFQSKTPPGTDIFFIAGGVVLTSVAGCSYWCNSSSEEENAHLSIAPTPN